MFGKIFKAWATFILLTFSSLAFGKDVHFIQFDTVRINIQKGNCPFFSTASKCYVLPYEVIEQFKPTKILDTDVPKFIKWQQGKTGYYFKVVEC